MVALYEYRSKIEPNANLLIYYAGHGYNDKEVEEAYWLPIDARGRDNANWISATDITKNVKGIPARHVLIVSDSCYSGKLRAATVGISEPSGREKLLQQLSDRKSRTVMASGGDEPVADGGGGGHSVFAKALLKGLKEMNRNIFTAEDLFINFIQEVVTGESKQTPEYNPILNSGHEGGDFIFIRKIAKTSTDGP